MAQKDVFRTVPIMMRLWPTARSFVPDYPKEGCRIGLKAMNFVGFPRSCFLGVRGKAEKQDVVLSSVYVKSTLAVAPDLPFYNKLKCLIRHSNIEHDITPEFPEANSIAKLRGCRAAWPTSLPAFSCARGS